MASKNNYYLSEYQGRWVIGEGPEGTLTLREAKTECKRRNAEKAQVAEQEKAEREQMREAALAGITVLPRVRNADQIARRLEQYNEEPPEG